ncbi:MAG: CotH kinase family protein [Bacteroidales bacterium]|nr:CotH kinase family protein [Bacteroidales bacterium]
MKNIRGFLIIVLIISIQSVRAIQTNVGFKIQFIYTPGEITIDGQLDEYSGYPSLVLLPNSNDFLTLGNIDDSLDCSARIWLFCDEDNLYLAGKITDNSVINVMTGGDIWDGDAVLFYFGLYDQLTPVSPHIEYHTGEEPDYQIGVSSTGLTYLWRWQIGEAGISIPDCEVFTTQNSNSWSFELKCPFSGLASWGNSEFEPAIGMVLPINIAIEDDDDGDGRETELYWMNDPDTEFSHARPELWGREVVICDTGSTSMDKPVISEVYLSSNSIYPGDHITVSANVSGEDSVSLVKCYFKNENGTLLDSVELIYYDIHRYENTWATPLAFNQSMDIYIDIFAMDTSNSSSQKVNAAIVKFYKPVLLPETVNYGDSYKVFDKSGIAEIRITMAQDSLDILLAPGNEGSYEYIQADFSYESENIPLTTIQDIGFRLRGAIPRYCQKRDYKISFNKFVPGRNFYGLRKFNLRSLNRDPGIIRETICLDLLNDMNVVSARAGFVKLYINDEYRGLYLNVEEVDRNFLNTHFGNSNGNLYKCARSANLSIREDGNYKFTFGPPPYAPHQIVRAYKLSTNESEDNYSDLINLIEVINNTSYYDFNNDLENAFNVRSFLKAQAVSVMVGDWDGYWSNQNNYYLYYNTATKRIEFIPRDLDLTLGVDWGGGEYATADIYSFGPINYDRPLIYRMFNVPEYMGTFSMYIRQLIDDDLSIDQIWPEIEETKEMIRSAVEEDTYRTLDYGWTINDFTNSYTEALGTFHAIDYAVPSYDLVTRVAYGLKPFIESRLSSASDQLDTINMPPVISGTSHDPLFPGNSESVTITATVNSYSGIGAVELNYNIGDGFQTVEMLDDGLHNDHDANDQLYGIVLPPYPDSKMVYYYISASGTHIDDISVSPENAPYSTYYYANGYTKPSIVINEFMSDNESTIQDETGEYEDWIELYNFGSEAVQLGGMYLTDNLQIPTKWEIPEMEIAPGEFLLFWADGDYGPLHTNFKLSNDGERIGLFDTDENGNFPIDFFTYVSQNNDESYGRSQDGGNEWNIFRNATPGQSNTSTSTNIDEEKIYPNTISHLILYPNYLNPFYSSATIRFVLERSTKVELKIFDLMGRKIVTLVNGFQTAGVHEMTWQPEGLPSGAYFCILQTSEFSETKKIILQK